MSTEIATVETRAVQTIPAQDASMLVEVIARAASDPTVDVGKMERLIELKRSIDADEARMAFASAMARVQPSMPQIEKDGAIVVNGQVRSKFSTYEQIDRVIRPIYSPEGLSISWNTAEVDGRVRVIGTLQHRMGHSREFSITLPPDTSGSKSAIQAIHSAVSQGRRMLLKMMFNIIETVQEAEDPDQFLPITEAQKAEIVALLRAVPGNFDATVGSFLKYMGVEELAQIQQGAVGKAKQALASKAAKK